MSSPSLESRLRLFAFTAAEGRHRYMAILRAFEEARDQSRLQLGPSDLVPALGDGETTDGALAALDQLHAWGLLERLQDDRRVRTIAEYRQRRSVYQMTELGWLAWHAVEQVLQAEPGEAELRRLVLPMVLDHLDALHAALEAREGERIALLLEQVHATLSDLARHAARFTLATSELASTWEADPAAFLVHKDRLLAHLDGFLAALTAHRPLLAAAVGRLQARADELIDLATDTRVALDGRDKARARTRRLWGGVEAWFVDRPGHPSQAFLLEERSTRAIRDLALLLKRVLDATAGGVSRATQLELLAAWVVACPGDRAAHALVGATSGLRRARHFGVPEADPDAVEPSTSWWKGPPAPVDTTLRKRGRASSPAPARPIPDRRRERRVLQQRQLAQREAQTAAGRALVEALDLGRPLHDGELVVLLRLLSRALHTRRPAAGSAATVHGRLRLRLEPAPVDTVVHTTRGHLVLEGHRLEVSASGASA